MPVFGMVFDTSLLIANFIHALTYLIVFHPTESMGVAWGHFLVLAGPILFAFIKK